MWYMIIALFIWASSFTVGKMAYTAFDPVMTVQLRLLIASLFVLPIFIKTYFKLEKKLKIRLFYLAILNFPIALLLQFIGLKYTSASSAVTIVGAEPLFMLIIGSLFFAQKNHWYDWALGMLAFIGILLLVIGGNSDGTVSVVGSALVVLAELSFVFSIFFGKNIMQQMDASTYTSAILTLGAITCLPFTLVLNQNWQMPTDWQPIGAVLYLGVACSWLAYWLFNKGLQHTPTKVSAMLIPLEPVLGVLCAMVALGERMSFLTGFGVVLVIIATVSSAVLHSRQ